MPNDEFAAFLEAAGIEGASLHRDGMGAVIYNSDTYETKEDAQKGNEEFYNKVNKLTNDTKRKFGTGQEDSHAKFTPFNRGREATQQGSYEWAKRNIQTSDAYKERLAKRSNHS